jgi:hypothetical protein
MDKQQAMDPRMFDAIKTMMTTLKSQAATDVPAALPYGLGAGAVGTAGGALYSSTEDAPEKELNKIKKALVLQELQSPTGDPEAMGKLSNEQLTKLAAIPSPATLLGMGLVGSAAIGIPGYLTYDWMKQRHKKQQVEQQITQINDLKKKYDQQFQDSIKEQLNVDPNAMEDIVGQMKTSSLASLAENPHLVLAGLASAGAGLGTLGFIKGKKAADSESERMQKIKMYRRSMEHLTKARPNAALIKLPMSTEEQVAMEVTRDTAPEASANTVKNTKGGTEAPKLSAKVNDPELQKLLQSV